MDNSAKDKSKSFFGRKKYSIAYFSVILLIAATSTLITNRKANKIYDMYPLIESNDSISGIVKKIYDPDILRHGHSVMVSVNDKKLRIVLTSINVPEEYYIYNYLRVGDYLIKKNNNDTVVLRDGKTLKVKYKYILRED